MSELRTNRIIPRDGLPSGSSGGIIQVRSTTFTENFSDLYLIGRIFLDRKHKGKVILRNRQ